LRIEFFGEEIERITRFEPLTGNKTETLDAVVVFPAKQFVTTNDKMKQRDADHSRGTGRPHPGSRRDGKLLEAQRIKMRTEYDLEMMEEMGFCSGIENYSRHISGRPPGSQPNTLFDFFPAIICSSLTNRTPPCRRSAGCTRATNRAKPFWSSTASACPARWTTGR
jgi:excinuclease ABC subunit B